MAAPGHVVAIVAFFALFGVSSTVSRILGIRYWSLTDWSYVGREVARWTGLGLIVALVALPALLAPVGLRWVGFLVEIVAVTAVTSDLLTRRWELGNDNKFARIGSRLFRLVGIDPPALGADPPDEDERTTGATSAEADAADATDTDAETASDESSADGAELGGQSSGRTALSLLVQYVGSPIVASERYVVPIAVGFAATLPLVAAGVTGEPLVLGFWVLVGGLCGWVTPSTGSYRSASERSPPPDDAKNVVFFMVDTARRDRMSVYGYDRPTTPFLEEFAEESWVFENCVSPSTRSGHSIPSLLSGAFSSIHRYGWALDDLRILSEEFADEGYVTGGISANAHVSHLTFADRFDWFQYLRRGKRYLSEASQLIVLALSKLGLRYPPAHYVYADIEFMHQLSKGFISEQASTDRPFFLYLSYMDIHPPYLREFDHLSRFADELGVEIDPDEWMHMRDSDDYSQWYRSDIKNLGYDELVRYTDDNIADLCRFLDQRDLLEDTVVVVTADHGHMLGEHDVWGHIDIPYNQLFEVPLLIKTDGTAMRVEQTVSGTEIPSLVFDAAGVDPSRSMRDQWYSSRSFEEFSADHSTDDSYAVVDYLEEGLGSKHYPHPFVGDRLYEVDAREQRLVVGSEWKLYQWGDETYFYPYDQADFDDPAPESDVPAEIRRQMTETLDDVREFIAAQRQTRRGFDGDAYADVTDQRVRSQLEDLGYIE